MTPIPRIKESIEDLNSYRQLAVKKNLKPIVDNINQLIIKNLSASSYFVIGVSNRHESGADYTDWRFKTRLVNFEAMYYERWTPFEKNIYFLDRIYFHIYEMDFESFTSKEYILLHCDSALPDNVDHARYKQSPHLHINCAPQPIPHAHFALNNYDIDKIFGSLKNLDLAMGKSIKMIEDQVFNLLENR